MSLRGKGLSKRPAKPGKGGKLGTLKKLGRAGLKGLSGLSAMRGRGGVSGRRRSRGITSRQFRTAQRVLKKIVKMYSKLPRRASHSTAACRRKA